MRKPISSLLAIATVFSIPLNCLSFIPTINAASFRTTYKIYGDLNGDNKIDIYDVISMRKEVVKGTYNKSLDFNCDNAVDSADLSLLNGYVLGENTFFDAYLCDDADEDSVCDMLEIAILQSDPDSEDTDGDTLTDYEEIVYSNTSPTNKNTRELAATDAEDDPDEDNLSNKEEIAAKTNPLSDDSDMDGISDYDELKKYNTDPNNEDSDNDGIIDGDEINLGLKPDSEKSDGTIPDYQRSFENKISSSNELFSYVNTEDAPYEVSVDIKAAGNAEKALSIQTGSFSNTSEDDHFIGKSLMFSYDEKLTVDTAKIYFKPKSIDGSIENYMIFEFFPETNYLLPVETKYTSDSAYVETNELGTFTLVKIKDSSQSSNSVKMAPYNILADEKSEISVEKNDVVYNYELGALEVAFFVDVSGSLTDNLEETKKSIHDFSKAVFEHSNNAYIEIIGYYTAPDLSTKKLIGYSDSNDDLLLNSTELVDEALENLAPYTTNVNNNLNYVIWDIETLSDDLFSGDNSQKYAFIISNSEYSFTDRLGYKVTIPNTVCESFETIHDSNIHLNFLLSKEIFNNKTAVNNLKDACKPYNFGVYSNLETGYFGNTGFARIYSDAITDIFKESICYISTLTPQTIPTEVNRNAFSNSLPSSYDKSKIPAADANGNINFKDAAVKIGAAYYNADGNLVFQSMLDACSYSELTKKGYEQYMKNRSTSERLIAGSIQITPFSDKILYEDNDGDGIPNKWDASPNDPIDNHFKVVSDYSSINYRDLLSYGYEDKLEESKNTFATEIPEEEPFADYWMAFLMAWGGQTVFGEYVLRIDDYMGQGLRTIFHPLGHLPTGSAALRHYIEGHGEDFCFENFPYAIALVNCQRINFYNNMNQFFDMVEHTVKEGCTYSFSTVKDLDRPEDVDTIKSWKINYHNCSSTHESIADDWWSAIGGGQNALASEVKCKKTDGSFVYTAKIRYYVLDVYDWENKGEENFANLHKYGYAENFLSYGCYETTIEWQKGSRYPYVKGNTPNYIQTTFSGINDANFTMNLLNGNYYYFGEY